MLEAKVSCLRTQFLAIVTICAFRHFGWHNLLIISATSHRLYNCMKCVPGSIIYDKMKSIFSQGVITLMAAVLGTNFFEKCYTPLGEVMDLVALANCTVMSNYM